MLDNLGLTYGLDSSRLGGNNGRGDMNGLGWGEMESMSWGELDNIDKNDGRRGGGRRKKRGNGPQRPNVDIITGSIKANFPSRISFQVASKYDSRTVLGEIGAEQLLGNGDMLMSKNGGNLIRYQSAFISDNEVNKLIKEIKRSQRVQYLEELEEVINNNDEGFESLSEEDEILISKSIDLIKSTNKASTSFLQRNFQVGYNKAARIMEALEQRGVVSPPNHAGKRDILINN